MDYVYTPLQSARHIRVLLLASAPDANAPLQCIIRHQHLDELHVQYECISYTWGGQEKTIELDCSGSRLWITPNLAAALRRFRSQTKVRSLWADAVSINQSDAEEKSVQVPLMYDIYRRALRVRVWLGEGDAEIQKAITSLSLIAKSKLTASELVSLLAVDSGCETDDIEAQVKAFFELPYFSRRWIIQELTVNTDPVLFYGAHKISWTTVAFAFQSFNRYLSDQALRKRLVVPIERLNKLWLAATRFSHPEGNSFGSQFAEVGAREEVENTFFELIEAFPAFECQDPRDKAYAILTLAADFHLGATTTTTIGNDNQMQLTVDYSLTVDDVYESLASAFLQCGRAAELLAWAGCLRTLGSRNTVASWIPDLRLAPSWSVFRYGAPSTIRRSVVVDRRCMITARTMSSHADFQQGQWRVGCPYVSETHRRHDWSWKDFRGSWAPVRVEAVCPHILLTTADSVLDVILQQWQWLRTFLLPTTVRTYLELIFNANSDAVGASQFKQIENFLQGLPTLDDGNLYGHRELNQFCELHLRCCRGRRLFITQPVPIVGLPIDPDTGERIPIDGVETIAIWSVLQYIGLGPGDLQIGDIVFDARPGWYVSKVQDISTHPVLFLRPGQPDDNCYENLGDGVIASCVGSDKMSVLPGYRRKSTSWHHDLSEVEVAIR